MGKKGRAKPKHKQTGKKRAKGKQASASRVVALKQLKNDTKHKTCVHKPEDYAPIRRQDSDEDCDDVSDMDEGDLNVFNQAQTDFKFLATINLERKDPKSGKKKRKLLENEEESYEKKPRLAAEAWKSEQHLRLPLKDKNGILPQTIVNAIENDETLKSSVAIGDETKMSEVNHGSIMAKEELSPIPLSIVDLLQIRQEKINEKKSLISELVSSLLEDPHSNIDKLSEMNKLCEEKDSDISITVRKLAIISQLEVFKDIIPGYPIRRLSDSEQKAKVSKDVKKVRQFEEGLLRNYQRYLEILEQTIKGKKKYRRSQFKHLQKGLPMIALQCLCDLLTFVPHFNYRTNIMAVLVPKMNDNSADNKISSICCETVKSIFKKDNVGEISLEIVQLINKLVKSQSFKVKPCVLETFLSLRLHDADLNRKEAKENEEKPRHRNKMDKMKKKRMSKNDRKRQKELKKIERELQEAEAVEGKEKSRKMQSEVIKLVFSVYFRILKTSDVCPLLAPVLAGLSKFTHLINIDFFADLMNVLKNLVASEDISSSDKLHCILTAFKILSGQGEALNVDPQAFYSHLYSTLLDIDKGISSIQFESINIPAVMVFLAKKHENTSTVLHVLYNTGNITIALDCLDIMLSKRRKQVSVQRLTAYIKRLCTVALHQSSSTSLALLSFARSFLQMNASSGIILDHDCAGRGVFRPDLSDPEYSNADSTTLWELPLFRKHYETCLRDYAAHISLGNPSQGAGSLPNQLSRKSPMELFDDFNETKQLDRILSKTAAATTIREKANKTIHSAEDYHTTAIQEKIDNCFLWLDKQDFSDDIRKVFKK